MQGTPKDSPLYQEKPKGYHLHAPLLLRSHEQWYEQNRIFQQHHMLVCTSNFVVENASDNARAFREFQHGRVTRPHDIYNVEKTWAFKLPQVGQAHLWLVNVGKEATLKNPFLELSRLKCQES